MEHSDTYSVVVSNELQQGFEKAQVQGAFAALFKIPREKAARLLKGRRILKKGVDLKTAEAYKRKLERIGLVVTLE